MAVAPRACRSPARPRIRSARPSRQTAGLPRSHADRTRDSCGSRTPLRASARPRRAARGSGRFVGRRARATRAPTVHSRFAPPHASARRRRRGSAGQRSPAEAEQRRSPTQDQRFRLEATSADLACERHAALRRPAALRRSCRDTSRPIARNDPDSSCARRSPAFAASASLCRAGFDRGLELAEIGARRRRASADRRAAGPHSRAARIAPTQRQTPLRRAHPAALVLRVAEAAEGARDVLRRGGLPRHTRARGCGPRGKRRTRRAGNAGCRAASRAAPAAADRSSGQRCLLGMLERGQRLVVAVDDAQARREA